MPVGTGIGAQLSSRAIIGSFYNTLSSAAPPAWVPAIAAPIRSDQGSETLRWLGMTPAMREWVGGRDPKGFRVNGITIENKTFEASVEVDVDDVRRDKTGQLMVRVNELAARAVQHRAKLLTDLIVSGESTACYDGQFFFDTDHAEGASGTQDNDLSHAVSGESGSTTTAPLPLTIQRATLKAIQAISGFKDDRGEPMNEGASAFTVMVPVPFMTSAMAAFAVPLIGGGDSNFVVNQNDFRITLAVNPRLTWTTKMAVFRTDGQTKPLIEQTEFDPQIDAIAEGSELEVRERKHLYTVTRAGNVAFGYWQHACLVTLT